MRAFTPLLFALALVGMLHGHRAAADPLPVGASVNSPFGSSPRAQLRLNQDICYTWGTPDVTVSGANVVITQTVSPIAGCTNPATRITDITLPVLPHGAYRLTYVPEPIGFGPMPQTILEFNVRTNPQVGIWGFAPLEPEALEPVEALVIVENCEAVVGVRPIDGRFRVELDRDNSNPATCDAGYMVWITLGAFAHGTYNVEVRYVAEDGGALKGEPLQFSVRPSAVRSEPFPRPDLSGLWFSANEELATGMSLVHTELPDESNVLRLAVIAIWYRYDADGRATWYWVEALERPTQPGYRGAIYAYTAANPEAPGWQRAVDATPVGTIDFRAYNMDRPARVDATIDGKRLQFTLQRIRWRRPAWPTPP